MNQKSAKIFTHLHLINPVKYVENLFCIENEIFSQYTCINLLTTSININNRSYKQFIITKIKHRIFRSKQKLSEKIQYNNVCKNNKMRLDIDML